MEEHFKDLNKGVSFNNESLIVVGKETQITRTWLSNNGLFFSEAQCCYLKDDMRLKPLLNCCYFFLINLLM